MSTPYQRGKHISEKDDKENDSNIYVLNLTIGITAKSEYLAMSATVAGLWVNFELHFLNKH